MHKSTEETNLWPYAWINVRVKICHLNCMHSLWVCFKVLLTLFIYIMVLKMVKQHVDAVVRYRLLAATWKFRLSTVHMAFTSRQKRICLSCNDSNGFMIHVYKVTFAFNMNQFNKGRIRVNYRHRERFFDVRK